MYVTSAVHVFGFEPVQVTVPIDPSAPLDGEPTMANVRLLLSASVALSVIVFAVSSSVVTDCAAATGAWFCGAWARNLLFALKVGSAPSTTLI